MEQALTQLEYPTSRVPYFKDMIFWRPSLRPHFYRLFRALNAPTSPLAPRVMLLDLVSALFATQTGDLWKPRAPRPESKAVAHVRAYLEAHCTESTSLENLAGLVNLSPYYLIRCFRQQIGCSPHLYQRHWQLLQVKQRLQTAEPLAEIAINCGFYDQSHLNRAFKRTFGVTPGQYRQDNFVQDC